MNLYGIYISGQGWVKEYDPNFAPPPPNPPYPNGRVTFTTDPRKAKTFINAVDAWECWRQQSSTIPLRPDGEPNRPLTAFHAEITTLDSEPLLP